MRKCNGYIYVEMLAALTVCLFIVGALYPLIDKIRLDRKNILLKTEAHQVLYEKLTAVLAGDLEPISTTFEQENRRYTLTWSVYEDFPSLLEGCIHYENANGKNEKICDATK